MRKNKYQWQNIKKMVFNQLRIERNENAFLELMPVGLHMIHFSLAHCDVSSLRLLLVVKNAAFLRFTYRTLQGL